MLSIQAFMGDKDAQCTLGYHYLLGTGGYERNEVESASYFKQAAGNGHEEALFMLIFLYESKNGGLNPENKDAAKWYKLAADKELSIAQWRVAQMYEQGTHGIAKNEKEAAERYKKAVTQSKKSYSSTDIQYLSQHRQKFIEKASAFNSEARKKSLFKIIDFYENGTGELSKDDPDAAELYKSAALLDNQIAKFKVIDFYEQGKLEELSGRSSDSWNLYLKAAESGYEKAINRIVEFCEKQGGNFFLLAQQIYTMAAERGNSKALLVLLNWYDQVDRHIADKDIYLFKLAAEQGHIKALYLLGYRYEQCSLYGTQEKKEAEKREAVVFYKKAAIKGHIKAIYRLLAIFKGDLPLEDTHAAFCYKLALEAKKDPKLQQGSEIDRFDPTIIHKKLIEFYEKGSAGISKDDADAGDIYEKLFGKYSAFRDKPPNFGARYTLAQMYEYGRSGLPQNDELAAYQYLGLTTKGSKHRQVALFKLVEFAEQERGGLSPAITSYTCLEAAQLGHTVAQYRVAQFEAENKKNEAEALKWYRKAAEGGHKDAQFALGEWYENGRGDLTVDPNAALLWYEKSAEQGHADAQYHAGRLHTLGINGMAIDLVKAKHWYTKAADQNHAYAKQALARLANVTSAPLPKTNAAQPSIAIPETSHHIHSSDITLHEVIGVGGFGKVYRATWKNSTVAAKELYNSQSTEVVKNFSAETAIMFRLRHPNIVQIFGVSVDKIPFLMVMEYIEGGSLYKLLRSRQPLSWNDMRLPLTKGIADGVAYLHAKEIIYRDLKSLNVLVRSKTAVLTDFGLAQAKKLATQSKSKHADGLIGTLPWMAPELFKMGGKHNEKTDVFAFAVTLWEISTARVPFDDQDNQASLHIWVTNGQRENIPNDCPPIIKQIIERCWDGNPDVRPSMTEVVDWLATGNAPTLHAAQSGYVPALYIS